MKNRLYGALVLALLQSATMMNACPTCLGRVEKNSPPFFTPEYEKYYQHHETTPQESSDTYSDDESKEPS